MRFGYGICGPAMQTICMQLVSKDRRGSASNMSFIGIDCGNLFGPTIAGFLVSAVQRGTAARSSATKPCTG